MRKVIVIGEALIDFIPTLNTSIKNAGVDTTSILRTNKANTALAFVSLDENGERDFLFYRKPSADMLLDPEEIDEEWFLEGDILHFCSVDLVDYPVKQAHKKAIEISKSKNMIISLYN